jgi:hypothetical protein
VKSIIIAFHGDPEKQKARKEKLSSLARSYNFLLSLRDKKSPENGED